MFVVFVTLVTVSGVLSSISTKDCFCLVLFRLFAMTCHNIQIAENFLRHSFEMFEGVSSISRSLNLDNLLELSSNQISDFSLSATSKVRLT